MFHVGQHVACIRDDWRDCEELRTALAQPRVGRVYTVAAFHDGLGTVTHAPAIGLILEETNLAWDVDYFRPLKDSALDVFRSLLVTPPGKVLDPVGAVSRETDREHHEP